MQTTKIKRIFAGLGVTTLAVVGVQQLAVSNASAHAATMTAQGTCTATGWDAKFIVTNDPGYGAAVLSGTGTGLDHDYNQGASDSIIRHMAFADTSSSVSGGTMVWTDHFTQHGIGATATKPADCAATVPVPTAPAPNPPTCDHAGSVVLPANSDSVKWTAGPGVNDVTAHTVYGYVFSDGTHSHVFTEDVQPKLTGDQCDNSVPVPPAPVPTAATCDTDGSVTIPANTDQVKWLVDGSQVNGGQGGDLGPGTYVVTAHTTYGNIFSDGTHSHAYSVTVLPKSTTGVCAPPVPCQNTGGLTDVFNTSTGVLTVRIGGYTEDGTLALYEASNPNDQTLIDSDALAAGGCSAAVVIPPAQCTAHQYQWDNVTGQAPEHVNNSAGGVGSGYRSGALFTVPADSSKCITTVTPVTPTVTQSVCKGGKPTPPTIVAAKTEGIDYEALLIDETHTMVIAVPQTGYQLGALPKGWVANENGTAGFEVTFTVPKCVAPPVKPAPHKVVPKKVPPKHLAYTGTTYQSSSLVGAAVLLLLGGSALSLVARRRKA